MEIKMKDILQDVVAHTHAIGFLQLLKFTADDSSTKVESLAEDRSIVMSAETKNPVAEFDGVFGMSNLDKLSFHLKNPEYSENAKLEVVSTERNGESVPTYFHFENEKGDFQNDYRFMSKAMIEDQLKTVTFRGANWNIEIEPSLHAVRRFKLMSQSQPEEGTFTVKTDGDDLVFFFGDSSGHAGSFVFAGNVGGTIKHELSWPVAQVLALLNLDGKVTMSIADVGAMKITVDSALATYEYILPAQSK